MTAPGGLRVMLLDIGGVLLTNGWDAPVRRRAADAFGLDFQEMDDRHHLTFDTYEVGKISLETYLSRVVFYRERPFTREEFLAFMLAEARPYPDTIAMVRRVAQRHGLTVGAVSNEGRELTVDRIRRFALAEFMQFFICSCFVHFRKPDEDIYRLALDVAQAEPCEAVYIDDRLMFVEVARGLGIPSIHHTDLQRTRAALAELGLAAD
jgi:putative hydrolase of the HAD superfamily